MRMKTVLELVRERTDWSLPRDLLIPEERPSHRPAERFRGVRLSTPRDVERARKALGLPLSLLEPGAVSRLGYPMNFRPRLLVARNIRPLVESKFPTIEFASEEAATTPRIEDLVVAMLHVDTLAARALALRNQVEPDYLLQRVLEEHVQRLATLVRLQDVARGIPVVGKALPGDQLLRQDRKNLPQDSPM